MDLDPEVRRHDPNCARDCESKPDGPTAEPDRGPAPMRNPLPELPDIGLCSPFWRDIEPLRQSAGYLALPRDPPSLPPDSPVTRSDRLLD